MFSRMLYETRFLYSLLLTLAVEIPIVYIFVKYLYRHNGVKNLKIILVGFLASTLTLPYLWFILPAYINDRNTFIVIGELLVILTETIIYNQLLEIKLSKSFIISLTANIFSILLGLLF